MIRVLISDVDGVLSDGGLLHFDDGERCYRGRTFSTLDSKGIWLLRQSGVQVWICGGDDSLHLKDRLDWIGVDGRLLNPKDKRDILPMLPTQEQDEISFIGNDINDLPLMEMVGLVACPADAHPTIWDYVCERQKLAPGGAGGGYTCVEDGGKGAVREFCDWLIEYNRPMAESPRR